MKPIYTSVDGGWTEFGAWSQCSAKCGGGNQTRNRSCTNPAPAYGGDDCVGSAQESQECNNQSCPGRIEICSGEGPQFNKIVSRI